ncbi:MAG: hypothetical protein K9N46_03070 [Candidatus Marinimicrobia bacterium]|nr:hypothetical protein [Candidatus Neomarinimicrobiota bacterium]MCF7828121.1 hypothetical protein [Candidatus Neomarinimicrobiota bacterium]MCF7879704.1 hypothetical protein [Candidatus Neomarinimicrobiota bacterium]
MSLEIRKVETKQMNQVFYTLPRKIYAGDDSWVQPLHSDIESVFDSEKNAFYQKGETVRYVAFLDDEPVGRIAGMVNRAKDYQQKPSLGGFGFFESIDDDSVASALFDAVAGWLQARDLDGMRGPINFGETDRWWGLLIENFETVPAYGMNYNPSYYVDLLRRYGFTKRHGQLSYVIGLEKPLPERLVKIAGRVLGRTNIEIRMINTNRLESEAETIRHIYNTAWQEMDIDNFFDTFTPLTKETVQQMIQELKPILLPEGAWLAFVNGEPASFVLTIPDINQALRYLNGKLNLLTLPRFLWHKRKIDRLRVLAYGTIKKYRRLGLEAGMFVKGIRHFRDQHPRFTEVLAAWTGEENWLMQRSIEAVGGVVYRRHSTFQKLFDGN